MEKETSISIHLSEDDTHTVASLVLDLRGDHFEAEGRASRNPSDPPRPAIGEELAIARALARLQDQVMDAARNRIERELTEG